MNRLLLLAALSSCTAFAQQPQRPSDAMLNGRIESQGASLNAIVNECAVRTGQLYEVIEKQAQEIQRLTKELEAAKPNT